jgi:hypothetical protein
LVAEGVLALRWASKGRSGMSRDELVRIDDQGVVHPVGRTASARMRVRKGEFRLMPGPPHVAVMRYVGSDGRRDEEDGAVVRLAGEVTAPGTMCDIVAMVAQTGWNGELLVDTGEVSRSIFFERGNIVAIQTSSPHELIGEIMYRLGVLSREQIELVLKHQPAGMRFGEAAVTHQFLRRERLFEMMTHQTEQVVFATLLVDDGMFYFLDRFDPARIAFRHPINAGSLLLEGVRRMDEGKYFHERIPSEHHVPVCVPGRSDVPPALAGVHGACDGKRSVLDVGRACGLSEFEVMHALFQLVQAGCVRINPPAPTGPGAIVSIFNEVIAVIYAAAGAVGKAAQLSEQLGAFATSTGIYDALFRGAGPAPDGTLDPDRVVQNLRLLAGSDPDGALAQWLHEYLTFALFDIGGQLAKTEESALLLAVGDRVATLAPKA